MRKQGKSMRSKQHIKHNRGTAHTANSPDIHPSRTNGLGSRTYKLFIIKQNEKDGRRPAPRSASIPLDHYGPSRSGSAPRCRRSSMSISAATTRPNPVKFSMALRRTAALEVSGKLGSIPSRCIPVRSRTEANAACDTLGICTVELHLFYTSCA